MSNLSSFFEKRHKKTHTQSNNQLADLFSKKQTVHVPAHQPQPAIIPNNSKPVQQMEQQQEVAPETKKEKTRRRKNQILRQKQQKNRKLDDGKNKEPENLDATIFVGNVPLECTHGKLKKHFQSYGKVEKVWFRSIPLEDSKLPKKASHILKKYQQNADTMNAYVRFSEQNSAKKACEANGSIFLERNIRVSLCQDKQNDFQSTIFIGNLPHQVKDQDLWDAFNRVGKIIHVRVIRKKGTLQGLGIAYIRFETSQEMKKAIKQMNGFKIGERPIRVKKAVEKERLEKKVKKTIERKIKKGRTPPTKNNKFFDVKGKKLRNAKQFKNEHREGKPIQVKTKQINKKFNGNQIKANPQIKKIVPKSSK